MGRLFLMSIKYFYNVNSSELDDYKIGFARLFLGPPSQLMYDNLLLQNYILIRY